MNSSILGLMDTFHIANQLLEEEGQEHRFNTYKADEADLGSITPHIAIIPPSLNNEYCLAPSEQLLAALRRMHAQGTVLCAVCSGTFILAGAGLLDDRPATTHWKLATELQARYPRVNVAAQQILINDIDIITAGGVMAWLDLALEITRLKSDTHIMRQLGRHIIVDPGERRQSFYRDFCPQTDHGDDRILKAQQHIQEHYPDQIIIAELASHCFLSERTFLRRFAKATGYKPKEYLQRLRIQKACELFESGDISVENVAMQVGYRDISAFRKTFVKNMGLTPSEFTHRFANQREMEHAV